METEIQPKNIIQGINYLIFFLIPHDGLMGGLWVLWKNSSDFVLYIMFTSIDCLVKDNVKNMSGLGTFIYGYPHQYLQK